MYQSSTELILLVVSNNNELTYHPGSSSEGSDGNDDSSLHKHADRLTQLSVAEQGSKDVESVGVSGRGHSGALRHV